MTKDEILENKGTIERLRREKMGNDPQKLVVEKEERKQNHKKAREASKESAIETRYGEHFTCLKYRRCEMSSAAHYR